MPVKNELRGGGGGRRRGGGGGGRGSRRRRRIVGVGRLADKGESSEKICLGEKEELEEKRKNEGNTNK